MNKKKLTKKEKFIKKAKNKYGDKYDYSLVEYINSETKVEIICNKHGIKFFQTPAEHIRGRNACNLCKKNPVYTTDLFIQKSKEIHGDKYDYSESGYIDSETKISIICPEHGKFKQLPINHMKGQGCPKCGVIQTSNKKTYTNEKFINKAKNTHGDKYDYSQVEYINSTTKVKIICPEHGEFEQSPAKHLRGQGCIKCARERSRKKLTMGIDEFIERAKNTHGDKYDYSQVEYINSTIKVKIICPIHGEFEQLPYDHISGHGCENCSSSISNIEQEISLFLKENNINIITSSKSVINPYQLDIYLPDYNIAIEFNGLYWHNELQIPNNYHINKTELCKQKEIRLIHIFEDEWVYRKDIVKSRLINILGLTKNKIYARKCDIKEINVKQAREFCENSHLQGYVNSKFKLGLFYNDELVSVMLFTKNNNEYILSRFCNKLNTSIVGGAGKLLKYFIRNYSPEKIISYADRRWSDGDLYKTLGFELKHINPPNYWYIVGKKRRHKSNFRKSNLIKEGFNPDKSEREIMLDRGIYRIYDCGTIRYEKKII